MAKKLKLYVWEDVLWDWSPGIMFAYAYDVTHARTVLSEKFNKELGCVSGEIFSVEPTEHTEPVAFFITGGS